MPTQNYERLAHVYDVDWGNFATRYVSLLTTTLAERNITTASILDLACGTGNLAAALANAGHTVKGSDLSPQMIQVAQKKHGHIPNVSFEVQNMAYFTSSDKFDLITCTFDSLNYLTTLDDVTAMFRNVANSLRQSGLFIFDFNTEQQYQKHHHGVFQREVGGESFVQTARYLPTEQIAITEFAFANGDMEIHRQRPYYLAELEPVMTEAGLTLVKAFAGFDGRPCTPESERVICITTLA